MNRRRYDLHARDVCLTLGHSTRIMGIVNVTPDSFSQDGCLRFKNRLGAPEGVRHALKLIREGADLIDVGGESTRPGALPVSVKEEAHRVIPVIDALARRTKIPISVDTYKPEVARRALDAGACIVNNIMGVKSDRNLLKMARDYRAAIVMVHMRGTPSTMRKEAKYKDVMGEVIKELGISVEKCREIGIKKDRIIVDPGIGFAKALGHNLEVMNHLEQLNGLGCPILLGTSRKSFIGEVLNKEMHERLIGTVATIVAGIMRGVHIVRVHDVKAVKEAAVMTDAVINGHA